MNEHRNRDFPYRDDFICEILIKVDSGINYTDRRNMVSVVICPRTGFFAIQTESVFRLLFVFLS